MPDAPEPKATRKQVFDAIDGERRHQDIRPKVGGSNAERLPVSGELIVMQRLVYKAMLNYSGEEFSQPQTLEAVREIAATAVRCLEHHGVIERQW